VATDIKEPPILTVGPTSDEKRAAVEQVLQSPSFLRADQLRSFLRFVCEMEIAGRGEQLSEYLIGVEALGRPTGYSPAEDPVVRRRAVHLREKLDEVYAGGLAGAALRVELPKGRYVPRFVRVEAPSPPAAPSSATPIAVVSPESDDARRFTPRHLMLAFLAGVFASSAVFLTWRQLPASRREHLLEPGVSYEAEAEENIFVGMTRSVMGCANCSGEGRVRNIGVGDRNYVELLHVAARAAGEKEVALYYLLDGQRSFFISVNNGPALEVSLSAHSWYVPSRANVKLHLAAGPNAIRFYNPTTYAPDLDRIVVRD
jgi:hypothetical protein